ncbi:MAG: hypothetical protein LBR11_10380 [Deltaproteobacteria bacterium]|jgi:hypothetical protein|nr:hypothetical protein [Deltaproteobacteria bacterium]
MTIPQYIQLFNDYIEANGNTFKNKIITIINYCKKFIKKKELLDKTLLSTLDRTELTYIKFSSIIDNIENSLVKNLNDVMLRLHSFDEDEYEQILRNTTSMSKNYIERMEIFKDYIKYVDNSIDFIDMILLKIDKLQLETAKIKSLDVIEIENLETVRDIDKLIENMKMYKI